MDRRLVRVQESNHALGLGMHRAALGQIRNRLGHVEESGDTAGRRGIHHDRVVDRPLFGVHPDHRFLDLAGQQHVTQPGSNRCRELHDSDPPQGASGDPEVVEHIEVFHEGGLELDGQRIDMSAAFSRRDLGLLVRQWGNVKKLRNPLAPFDFHQ